jgi:hypothetical protein
MLAVLTTTQEIVMSTSFAPSTLLRSALIADAVASGGMGLLLGAAAGPLSGLLGLPQPLLLGAGLVCLAWAAITGWLGRRATLSRGVVWSVIILNVLWVTESAFLLISGWVSPTMLGNAFVLVQALLVAGFTEAQYLGLKKSEKAEMAAA